jgi:hypothetical protein
MIASGAISLIHSGRAMPGPGVESAMQTSARLNASANPPSTRVALESQQMGLSFLKTLSVARCEPR